MAMLGLRMRRKGWLGWRVIEPSGTQIPLPWFPWIGKIHPYPTICKSTWDNPLKNMRFQLKHLRLTLSSLIAILFPNNKGEQWE